MGRALNTTAESLACSERTLRRYINQGLLRGRQIDDFRFELPEQEERYARDHWTLLHGLRAALRTDRDVRLAVLFGSTVAVITAVAGLLSLSVPTPAGWPRSARSSRLAMRSPSAYRTRGPRPATGPT